MPYDISPDKPYRLEWLNHDEADPHIYWDLDSAFAAACKIAKINQRYVFVMAHSGQYVMIANKQGEEHEVDNYLVAHTNCFCGECYTG